MVACCNAMDSLLVPLAVNSTAKNSMVFRYVRKPRCPYYASLREKFGRQSRLGLVQRMTQRCWRKK